MVFTQPIAALQTSMGNVMDF